MTPLCYMLAAVTVAFAVTCVLFRRKNRSFEGMVCKFMASFGFIAVAIVGYTASPKNTMYFCLVCFALMFGFCGDVLLGIKEIAPKFRSKLIPIGTFYFLIGHVFFIVAFLHEFPFHPATVALGVAGGVAAFVIIKVFHMKVDAKMMVLLCIYYSLLVFKIALTGYAVLKQRTPAAIAALIGSLLFILSDTCLGIVYFTPVKRKNAFVTVELSTYYPAQILLAMSVALM
ncbi:MAG: lysoplasmalogenase [Clostridia bacterium]|nr:lysoplasmalogenase [Clostridia bacterium]